MILSDASKRIMISYFGEKTKRVPRPGGGTMKIKGGKFFDPFTSIQSVIGWPIVLENIFPADQN